MKDEWVTAALSNDAIVVDILFHLKQSSSSSEPTLHPVSSSSAMCLPFGWGHRQPRSKPPISSSFKKDSAMTTSTTRCSPTTPLSWSGGGYASPSDGAYEDSSNSSRPSSFDPSRSKGSYYTNEAPNSAFKKLRKKKKKTFSELKEEENFRLKERVHLKRELAMMHVTVEEQKARRENLKRIKVDLNINSPSYPTTTTTAAADVLEGPVPMEDDEEEASTTAGDNVVAPPSLDFPGNTSSSSSPSPLPTQIQHNYNNSSSKTLSQHHHQQQQQKRHFVLPDLNMTPSEDEIMAVP